jgi:quercetin dioxygenase-like cupin family protein
MDSGGRPSRRSRVGSTAADSPCIDSSGRSCSCHSGYRERGATRSVRRWSRDPQRSTAMTDSPAASRHPAIPPDDPHRRLAVARPDADTTLPHVGLAGDTYTILLTGADTAGRYTLIDIHVPPGGGPPPHRHDFEEMFTVLDGEVELTFRGEHTVARAGETVNVPANAPHGFANTSAARRGCCARAHRPGWRISSWLSASPSRPVPRRRRSSTRRPERRISRKPRRLAHNTARNCCPERRWPASWGLTRGGCLRLR